MPRKPLESPPPRVIGTKPLGVTDELAAEIIERLREQLSQDGRAVTMKALRFVPSSRAEMGNGSFQVVANAVFEVGPARGTSRRLEALDSVVTVGVAPGNAGSRQRLEEVTIPALRHVAH